MKVENALPRLQLVEVWGDTVDGRHLAYSILLGISISLCGYYLAKNLLASYVSSAELARAYAMLAGLGGCILSGVLCAILFKPKRVVVEGAAADSFWREDVLRQLEEQTGDIGSVSDLSPEVVKEMKELQIYDLFASYEKSAHIKGELNSITTQSRAQQYQHQHQGASSTQIKEA